jgi:ABC-type transport system involved in multi-copper enzyme maturation permease subunit
MFTLITREIRDHIVYFIGAAVLSAIFVTISIAIIGQYESFRMRGYSPGDQDVFSVSIGIPIIAIVVIGICGLGVTQMYLDRNRNISAFLSTLAVSRGRILLAKIVTGILVILTLLLPVAVAAGVLLRLFVPPVLIYPGIVFEVFITVFLMAFACYCIGLQTGWTSGKIAPTLGGIVLTCIFVPLILIKGFGLQIVVILVLFIIASLIRVWHTFMTTSL